MSLINERHIDTDRAGGGHYPTLMDYLNRAEVVQLPFSETDVAIASTQCILINTAIRSGVIALGTGTAQRDGGLMAARLPATKPLATADTAAVYDSFGNILNIVNVRNSETNDPVTVGDGRTVFGLLQLDRDDDPDTGYFDGTVIGDTGNENCQVSFVYKDANGTLQLVALDETIELSFSAVYSLRYMPSMVLAGLAPSGTEVMDPASMGVVIKSRYFVVSGYYPANSVINISSGTGSTGGSATPSGDVISTIGLDETAFNNETTTRILLNGTELFKDNQVHWDSATTFHMVVPMDVGDVFTIEVKDNE
jgi:hypothetical protein